MSTSARAVALILAGLLLLAGLALSVGPGGAGLPLALIAVLILLGVVFERRYGGGADLPHPAAVEWQPTGERFVDPESGMALEVWIDPLTGTRRYEPIGDLPTPGSFRRLPEGREPPRLDPARRDPI